MARLFLFFNFLFLFLSCSTSNNNNQLQPHLAVPSSSNIVVKINDFSSFREVIFNSPLAPIFKKIAHKKNVLDHFLSNYNQNQEAFLFLMPTGEQIEYGTVLKLDGKVPDTVVNQEYAYEKFPVEEISIKPSDSYFRSLVNQDLILLASSKTVIQEAIRKYISEVKQKGQKQMDPLGKIIRASNNRRLFSVFMNTARIDNKNADFLSNIFHFPIKKTAEWCSLEFDLNGNSLDLKGVITKTDLEPNLLSLLKETTPKKSSLSKVTPKNAESGLFIGFNEPLTFARNLNELKKVSTYNYESKQHFTQNIDEIGIIQLTNHTAAIFHTINPELIRSLIEEDTSKKSSYKGTLIYQIFNPHFFLKDLFPFLNNDIFGYYTIVHESYFIFSSNIATLQQIISNYNNESTLLNSIAFKENQESLLETSHLTFFQRINSLKALMTKKKPSFGTLINKANLSKYPFALIQATVSNGFGHLNGTIKMIENKLKKEVSRKNKGESIIISKPIAKNPTFFTNHYTYQKEIILQDNKNQLRLLNKHGKQLWKASVEGPINGEIYSIDVLNNKKFQLAFKTSNKFYVVDRNGNVVRPFPIIFKNPNQHPLSVFDYEKNRKYRFCITENNRIKLYNKLGKIVKGFSHKPFKSKIIYPAKHIRINSRDYIVTALENGDIKILNRQGKTRTKVKEKINTLGKGIYQFEDQIIMLDGPDQLAKINPTSGAVSRRKLKGEALKLFSNKKYIVILGKDYLAINDVTINLRSKNNRDLHVFTLKKKYTFICLSDPEEKKLYLYNSKGKLLKGFPIVGDGKPDLYLSNKGILSILVKGSGASEVLIYKIAVKR